MSQVTRWTQGAIPAEVHAANYLASFKDAWARAGLDPVTITPLDSLTVDEGIEWVQDNGSSFVPALEATYQTLVPAALALRSDLPSVFDLGSAAEAGASALAAWRKLTDLEERRAALNSIRIGLVVVGAVPDQSPSVAKAVRRSMFKVLRKGAG